MRSGVFHLTSLGLHDSAGNSVLFFTRLSTVDTYCSFNQIFACHTEGEKQHMFEQSPTS